VFISTAAVLGFKYLPLQKKLKSNFEYNYKRSKLKYKLILILGSLTALGPFSIDMYLPGFLELQRLEYHRG
jgi:DHA1 family bicyclomycin/chloramphenicol resistance-like MFS transporter